MPIGGDKYPFTHANVDVSPEEPGVYALYDVDELIYIGSTEESIRSRLKDHFSGREGPCTGGATHYRRERTHAARARERELLAEYRRANGKLPRCNEVMP